MPRQRDAVTILADHEAAIRRMRATLARVGFTTLEGLGDTTLDAPPATGDVLQYTGAVWENQTLAEAGISPDTHNHDLTYSLLTHDHDPDYSALGHNHDADYVELTGDTMSGALTVQADITATGQSIVIDASAATQTDGPFIFKQEAGGEGRIGFFTTVWDNFMLFKPDSNQIQFGLGNNVFQFRWDGSFFWLEDDGGTGNRFVFDHVNEIRADAGSAADPSYVFQTDQTSGLYLVGSSNPAVAAGGARAQDWHNNGGTLQARFTDGSVSKPSQTFISDNDTGLYRVGSGQLGIATNGSNYVRFGNNSHMNIAWNGASVVGLRLWEGDFSGRRYDFRRAPSFGVFEIVGYTSGGSGTVGFAMADDGTVYVPKNYNVTSTASADVFIESDGRLGRSTSSLKYKPDWQYADEGELADLELPVPIVWTELRKNPTYKTVTQDIYLGFGTEHVYDMLPAATQSFNKEGKPENYDIRSLVAILSAKVKRLETALQL